jgi:Fe-S oxidoreductase
MGNLLEAIETSCCGMGGLFGHQKEHKQLSRDMWDIHWSTFNPSESDALTTGFSCQSQSKRFAKIAKLILLEFCHLEYGVGPVTASTPSSRPVAEGRRPGTSFN